MSIACTLCALTRQMPLSFANMIDKVWGKDTIPPTLFGRRK